MGVEHDTIVLRASVLSVMAILNWPKVAILKKVVLQVSTCHVIAQKKLSSLVSGGRTQYKVHSTHQIPSIGQLWQFFENLHFRVSIYYDAIAQKKHNYLVNGGRTQDEVHANHQIPVIGYDWLQVAAIGNFYLL